MGSTSVNNGEQYNDWNTDNTLCVVYKTIDNLFLFLINSENKRKKIAIIPIWGNRTHKPNVRAILSRIYITQIPSTLIRDAIWFGYRTFAIGELQFARRGRLYVYAQYASAVNSRSRPCCYHWISIFDARENANQQFRRMSIRHSLNTTAFAPLRNMKSTFIGIAQLMHYSRSSISAAAEPRKGHYVAKSYIASAPV